MGRNLAEFPLLVVPQPVPDYCTHSVLTMDFVDGVKITALFTDIDTYIGERIIVFTLAQDLESTV